MSSPGAASFSTLSSYASSAPDRQGNNAVGLPLPATAQTTTPRTTLSISPSSANAINILTDNSKPSNHINNAPNLGPRSATIDFKLLPDLETGLDINRLKRLCQEQQSIPTCDKPDEEQESEIGWKDAYEALLKAPLQSLAALARRFKRARAEREGGMV